MKARGGVVMPTSEEAGVKKSHGSDVLPFHSSLWGDSGFDAVKFTSSHILFFKEIPGDYKVFNAKSFPKLSDMKENHLIRGLMLEHVDREK